MSCELQRTGTPSACNLLCARRAEKFQKFCNSFAQIWRNICVISTPNASFVGMERTFDSGNFSDVSLIMRSARWPDARRFCARDAPDFRKFCTTDSVESCYDVLRFKQRTWAECTQTLRARCAKNSRKFSKNFHAISAQSLRDLNAGRVLVRMPTHA